MQRSLLLGGNIHKPVLLSIINITLLALDHFWLQKPHVFIVEYLKTTEQYKKEKKRTRQEKLLRTFQDLSCWCFQQDGEREDHLL